jgi:hypothetical protein
MFLKKPYLGGFEEMQQLANASSIFEGGERLQ